MNLCMFIFLFFLDNICRINISDENIRQNISDENTWQDISDDNMSTKYLRHKYVLTKHVWRNILKNDDDENIFANYMLITFCSLHSLGPYLQAIASSSDLASNSRLLARSQNLPVGQILLLACFNNCPPLHPLGPSLQPIASSSDLFSNSGRLFLSSSLLLLFLLWGLERGRQERGGRRGGGGERYRRRGW